MNSICNEIAREDRSYRFAEAGYVSPYFALQQKVVVAVKDAVFFMIVVPNDGLDVGVGVGAIVRKALEKAHE